MGRKKLSYLHKKTYIIHSVKIKKAEILLRISAFLFSCKKSSGILVLCVGHQGYVSCSLDCCCQRSLMFCAVACDSSGKDFTSFGNVSSQFAYIFVIDCCHFICTALAYAFFSATTFFLNHVPSLLFDELEGQIVVFDAFVDGVETVSATTCLLGSSGCGSSRGIVTTAAVVFEGRSAFCKVLFFYHNLCCPVSFPFVVVPGTNL